MEMLNLSKRFYEKSVLEGSKEILNKAYEKTSITGSYLFSTRGLVLPEILATLLIEGFDLKIFMEDCGIAPTICHITVLSNKKNSSGEILKINFDGPIGNREKDAIEYKNKILEAKNIVHRITF